MINNVPVGHQPQMPPPYSMPPPPPPPLDVAALITGISAAHADATAKLVTTMQESMNANHRQLIQELRGFVQGDGHGRREQESRHDPYYELKRTFFTKPGFTEKERDECSAGPFKASMLKAAKNALLDSLEEVSEVSLHSPMYLDEPFPPREREWIVFSKRSDTGYIGSVTGSTVFQSEIQGWGLLLDMVEEGLIAIDYELDTNEYLITRPQQGVHHHTDGSGNGSSLALQRPAQGRN